MLDDNCQPQTRLASLSDFTPHHPHLDLAPEVEGFGGGKCFRLLRLAQLAALGYLVSVLLVHFHLRSHIQTQERQCALNLSKRVVHYSYSNAIVSWTLRVKGT